MSHPCHHRRRAISLIPVHDTDGQVSRTERSRLTHDLLGRADRAVEPERRELLDRVVVLNCRIADAVAARYRDRGVPLEDLQQVAYEALIKAVRHYDLAKADDLLTFAVPTIRGEVQRHFRDRSWMVRPPRRVQELQARTTLVLAELRAELGREPADHELCDRLGIDAAGYAEVQAARGCFSPVSLDRPLGDDGTVTLGDLVVDGRSEHDAAEARCLVDPALIRLPVRDRQVIHLRFTEGLSQREIGDELGLSSTQVSRLLDRVLRTLRIAVAPDGLTA